MIVLFRIQDKDGRGPYKPGFSKEWSEMRCLVPEPKQPPFMEEFPGSVEKIYRHHQKNGGHFGCAFQSMEQLKNWFTESEIEKLYRHGYSIVKIQPDAIIEQSENQTVFWCKKQLRKVAY